MKRILIYLLILVALPFSIKVFAQTNISTHWDSKPYYTTYDTISDIHMGRLDYKSKSEQLENYVELQSLTIDSLEAVIDSLENIEYKLFKTRPDPDPLRVFYLEVVGRKLDSLLEKGDIIYSRYGENLSFPDEWKYFISPIYDTIWLTSGTWQTEKGE